jgi:hypothetical protein
MLRIGIEHAVLNHDFNQWLLTDVCEIIDKHIAPNYLRPKKIKIP